MSPAFEIHADLASLRSTLLAVPVSGEKPAVSALARDVARLFNLDLADEAEIEKASSRAGEIVEFAVSAPDSSIERLLLVGVGSGSAADLRKAGAALGRRVRGKSDLLASGIGYSANEAALRAHLIALALSTYAWSEKKKAEAVKPVVAFEVVVKDKSRGEKVASVAKTYVDAVWMARDLIHTPAATKSPQYIADAAKSLSKSGLTVRVRDEDALEREGFGGLLAVGMSSPERAPRLVEISYAPRGSASWPHVVIAGKGIVFDTGGISLKRPYDMMVAMKTDMSGSAAVLATLSALPTLGLKVRVTGLLALAENALSAFSQRPSDVITQYGGTTVEILNTDAEGRLVLADCLAYADLKLDPDVVVDIATLTGAASLGLGRQYAAMYTRDNKLAEAFSDAGETSGDRVWRMPLVDDYRFSLDSDIADICHVSDRADVSAGSVTAALFLETFVGQRPWVHLDIAGTARSESESGENPKGGTGYGVRLLLDWLTRYAR